MVAATVNHMQTTNTIAAEQTPTAPASARTYRVSLAFCNEDAHLADVEHLGFADGPCLDEYPVAVTFLVDTADVNSLLDLLDEIIRDDTTATNAVEDVRHHSPVITKVEFADEIDPANTIRDYEIAGLGFPYRAYDHDFGSEGINTRTIEEG